jgi:hypothetical protein
MSRVTNVKKKREQVIQWDEAIQETRKKIERLRSAIVDFEQRRDSGEAWPAAPVNRVPQ